ncbi:MAG: M20/M25/M40 family metallo-hydrolase [Caulobacter sp.]
MKPMAWMTAGALMALASAANAQTATAPKSLSPDQAAFRALYQELVEINTTLSVGSCTAAAEAMGARLKAAGYPETDVKVVVEPKHPREGSLVAVLRGSDAKTKPMLLLAHIDVVEAKREDWTRDPFKLVEENGYFYGRGTSDDKAQAAIWVDSLIRLKQSGFKPKRDIKMALTCGEESEGYNGIEDLVKNHRPLVDAEFALNEGASGLLDEQGKAVMLEVQAGEKVYQDFTLTVTNPGGHSSRPTAPNAIYQLSAALDRIGAYQFPPRFNDATRGYFTQMQARVTPEQATAMKALVADINDPGALALITKDRTWNSMLRTTCVATMVNAGHAPNALPQRATANINCRILPGMPIDEVKAKLTELAADPAVAVTLAHSSKPASPPPPLTPAIMGPIQKNAAKLWPGVPILPVMSTGATDAVHTSAAGIPTYGVTGLFHGPDGTGAHGLNERMRVQSLYEGRDFLYGLIKDYAGGK